MEIKGNQLLHRNKISPFGQKFTNAGKFLLQIIFSLVRLHGVELGVSLEYQLPEEKKFDINELYPLK